MIRLGAEEAVVPLETHSEGPTLEGSGGGVFGLRGEVPLTHGHGVVAVVFQDAGQRGGAPRDATVVAG